MSMPMLSRYGPGHLLGAAHADVVGGVGAVAACAVSAQKIVPAVAIHHISGFAVDGDVNGLVAGHAHSRFGVELDDPDEAEISSVGEPQPAVGGIEQERRIDCIAVLDAVRRGDDGIVFKSEVGGFRVERLGPHDVDIAGVSACQSASSLGIGDVVAIPDVDDVGGHSAAGTHGPAVPGPAVVGDQASAAGAESVKFAIALA